MTHKKKDCLEVKWKKQTFVVKMISNPVHGATSVFINLTICRSRLFQQRPRKVGAKFTGTGIAPDEHSQVQLDLDYDGKRDRWNGYDPEEHQRIVEEYAKVDLVSSRVMGST